MKMLVRMAVIGAFCTGAAFAQGSLAPSTDASSRPETSTVDPARAAVHDALEAEASLPADPPSLPDTASARATYVHQNIAFGAKGAAEKAAHSQADRDALDAASRARADAANRAAQGAAASAARNANADSHAAAGQNRQDAARGHGNGTGNGPGSNSGNGRNPLRGP